MLNELLLLCKLSLMPSELGLKILFQWYFFKSHTLLEQRYRVNLSVQLCMGHQNAKHDKHDGTADHRCAAITTRKGYDQVSIVEWCDFLTWNSCKIAWSP